MEINRLNTNNHFMRNYKRNIFRVQVMVLLCVAGLASCTKKLNTINIPPFGAPNTTLNQLYVAFVSNMALSGGDQNDDNGWLYPIAQQGMVYTHPDFPYGSTGIWSNYYHNLANYNVYMQQITASPDSTLYTNAKAMLTVLRAYQTIKVSDFYGDMPFSAVQTGYINALPRARPSTGLPIYRRPMTARRAFM